MTLLACALLIPVAFAARMVAGRWMRPGAIFAGYWVVAGIAPLVLSESPRVSVRAVADIAVAVMVFSLGAVLASGVGAPKVEPASRPVLRLDRSMVMWAIRIGTGSGIAASLLALWEHGLSAYALLSVDGLLTSGNTFAVQRYAGQSSSPLVAGLLAVMYAAALIAPYGKVLDPAIRWWWVLAPTLAATVFAVVTTEKAALLVAGSMTAGGYLAARTLKLADAPKVTRRGLALAAGVLAVVVFATAGMMFVRIGRADAPTARIVADKMVVYTFGYLPGFSQWLDRHDVDAEPFGWGTATVAGASLLTGQSRSDTRAYDEHIVINDRGESTNIYTIFRGLLMDFGTAGAALALFVFGWAAGAAFRRTTANGSLGAGVALGCLYVVVLFSSINAVVTFTNVCAAMLLAAGFLRLASNRAAVRDGVLSGADEPVAVCGSHSLQG